MLTRIDHVMIGVPSLEQGTMPGGGAGNLS
jgi:hypothetical protein